MPAVDRFKIATMEDAETAVNRLREERDFGSIPSAELEMSDQPTTADTIGIGSDVYEFVTAAGDVAADVNIGVAIGGSAAATQANLVAAINATDADNAHANLKQTDSTTPAVANGTEDVVADSIGTSVRVRTADAPGGNPYPADWSIALAEAITHGNDVWNVGTVNMNTLAGKGADYLRVCRTKLTITTAMITATFVRIEFPFQPVGFIACVYKAGVLTLNTSDGIAIDGSNGGLLITLGTTLADGDVLMIEAWAGI